MVTSNRLANNYPKYPFVTGFILAVITVFFITLTLNYFIDPYWYNQKRIKYFNDIPSEGFVTYAPAVNIYNLQPKGNAVRTSFVGTSHVLYGISVCGNPGIEKFGVLAMHLDESIRLTQKILAESKVSKTVFIEVSSNAIIIPERQKNYYEALISFSTTVNSLNTLKNSISASLLGADKTCSTPTMKADEHKSIDEEIKAGFPIKLLSPDEYHSLSEIVKIKAKKGIQYRIVFFIAPLPKEILAKENYRNICNKVSQQMQQTIDGLQKSQQGIKLSFINLIETDIGSKYQFKYHTYYSGWYDSNHFKPVIGDEVTAYLLKKYNIANTSIQ